MPDQTSVKKLVVHQRLVELHPHPRQCDMFADLPDADLRQLADEMRREGLIDPVEILPDGMIISGHQRVRAAKLLGWKEVRCWVRHDLEKAGPDAVERRFIEANFNRRQLGPLDKARCYRRLKELERGGRCNGTVKGDLRDYLAGQFGLSGRSLDRWERLLDTPIEVQNVVSAKKLPLLVGGKVADLPKGVQQQIAAEIRNGAEPKKAVASHLPKATTTRSPATEYHHLIVNLRQAVESLDEAVDTLYLSCCDRDLPVLRKGRGLIKRIIEKIKAVREERFV